MPHTCTHTYKWTQKTADPPLPPRFSLIDLSVSKPSFALKVSLFHVHCEGRATPPSVDILGTSGALTVRHNSAVGEATPRQQLGGGFGIGASDRGMRDAGRKQIVVTVVSGGKN